MYCRSLIVLAAMAGLWPNLLVARSYYVSTSGNDQWPGTIEKPFASLSFQAGRLAPGADVIVMEGTYLGPVRIDLAGTAAKPISISAAKGATVIIDGSKTDAETDLGRVDKRDSRGALNVIQAGICDGDQLGTRPDVGR